MEYMPSFFYWPRGAILPLNRTIIVVFSTTIYSSMHGRALNTAATYTGSQQLAHLTLLLFSKLSLVVHKRG
jgi:hypothetical protein